MHAKLTIDIATHDIPQNTVLDFSDERDFNGTVFLFITSTDWEQYKNATKSMRNVEIIGPGREYGHVGDVIEEAAFFSMQNVIIRGFGTGLLFGNSTWCNSFFGCSIYRCNNIIDYPNSVGSGENIRFFGSTFFNSINGITIKHGASLNFHSCAFDYIHNNVFDIKSGATVFLNACHIESKLEKELVNMDSDWAHFSMRDSTTWFVPGHGYGTPFQNNSGNIILDNNVIYNLKSDYLQEGNGNINSKNMRYLGQGNKYVYDKKPSRPWWMFWS